MTGKETTMSNAVSTAPATDLCRITVHGPKGRADLAVPVTVPVAQLLPVLVARAGEPEQDGTWVLQRLGGPPLEPGGTPESLDWRDGTELHLRPAADPLPELDFDDVADGMATAVGQRADRWRPELNSPLFLGFCVAALVAYVVAVLSAPSTVAATAAAGAGAAALSGGALVAGALRRATATILLLGLGGCVFAGLTGAVAVAGPAAALQLRTGSVLAGGLATAAAAVALLVARAVRTHPAPAAPFGVLAVTGSLAGGAQWLHTGVGLTPPRVAAVLCAALLVVLVFAPRLAIRVARIRGPQLPRTAEELQYDIEPLPAGTVVARTAAADGYLTVAAVSAAVAFACSFPVLVSDSVAARALAALVAVAALLHARTLLGAWQRVPLAAAGGFGLALVGMATVDGGSTGAWTGWLVLLALAFGMSFLAVVRPPGRRLLPIWGHLANGLEIASAAAVLPLLLQLFGVYALASGVGG
jgi:ESX secretion system protein EccD